MTVELDEFPDRDELYLDLRRRLPAWVFHGLEREFHHPQSPIFGDLIYGDHPFLAPAPQQAEQVPKDPVYGSMTTLFGDYYRWLDLLAQQTRISQARGEWLDLHAEERGTRRFRGEDDERLRARLRVINDVATERALKAAVDEMLPGDQECECFTLRYEQLPWRRRAWRRGKRWAVTALPERRNRQSARRTLVWQRGYWRIDAWGSHSFLRGPRERESPHLVAVVVVPRQVLRVATFWRRNNHWRRRHWGGTRPNVSLYRAIRELLEERKAAGITIWIWITEEEIENG